MKRIIKEKLLDRTFLAQVFEMRSKAVCPYDMAKELGISNVDVKDVLISPEYKSFSEDWFNTIQDSSRIARAKTIKLVNQYESHALLTLFELATDSEKPHERISAAKAALAHCTAVIGQQQSNEYQELKEVLEELSTGNVEEVKDAD